MAKKYPSPKFRPERHKKKYDYVKGHYRKIHGKKTFIHGQYRKRRKR